jgi:hypothetical protein
MKKFFAIFAIAVFAVACAGNQQPKATEEVAAVDTVAAVVDTVAVVADSTVVAE